MQATPLRDVIQKETEKVFQNNRSINTSVVIDSFLQILSYPLNKSELKLDGLETNVPIAIEKILSGESTKNDSNLYFPAFAKIEAFLRKVCYLIYPAKYLEMESNKAGFAAFISYLRLNPNNVDFERTSIAQLSNSPIYEDHLLRTYLLRNIESHQCESWTGRELHENIESVLVIYLYVTHKYASQLKPILDAVSENKEPDFKNYLESVKENFKSRLGRFVHIKGHENISISQGYVVENITNQEKRNR